MGSDSRDGTVECTFCGRSITSEPCQGTDGASFCSEGCRDLHDEFDAPVDRRSHHTSRSRTEAAGQHRESDAGQRSDAPTETQTTFLRVDGMHSVTCETFLESTATALDGVTAATASYVTETVRVDHDDSQAPADLEAALSTLGYTAYRRDDLEDTRDREAIRHQADATRRSREMSGMRKRRSEQFLQFRYAAGLLFAAFLLLPYVVLVYPAHLADLFDVGFLELYSGSFQLEGSAGVLFLRFYFLMTAVVLLFTGMPILRGAFVSLRVRRPNTDLLVAITVLSAVAYSVVAVPAGRNVVYFDVAIVVAAAVTAAAFYETATKQRALEQLTDLTISHVHEARRYGEDGRTESVDVDELSSGDQMLVRAGERVPVDATLVGDGCTVDEAVVTGESLPVRKESGDDVVGGSVITDGAAVLGVGDERTSTIDRITRSVWDVQSADHGVQRRADRVAAVAIPVVVVLAAIAGLFAAATGGSTTTAALAALGLLLAATPWALGLAAPLSVASGVRAALEHGIVVFDESIFERLRSVDVVVFDKTGTLTTGATEILEADAPSDLLRAVAAVEQRASHPAGAAIAEAYGPDAATGEATGDASSPSPVDVSEFESYDAGVGGTVDGEAVLAGSLDLFAAREWTVPDDLARRAREGRGFGRLPVLVGRNGRAEGLVVVGDEPRDGWDATLDGLAERAVDVVVLTGDDAAATEFFTRHDAVEHVFTGVPPAGKTAAIHRMADDRAVAMVGDGTNDAPALAAADLGVALGSGTALAADAADLAIATDELRSVETAFDLATAARRRVRENAALAFGYNAIAIPVTVAGLASPVTVIGAVLVSGGLLAANATRPILRSKED